MTLFKDRQTSFAGGEFAPSLYGRTDLQKYGSAVKLARNFFVSPHGTLLNRPGSECISILPPSAGIADGDSLFRIVPFIFSDTDTALLIFQEYRLYIFVYDASAGHVVNVDPITHPVEFGETAGDFFDTPYTNAQLRDLRFAQSGDVVTVVHPSHAPRELRRLEAIAGLSSFSFDVVSFALPEFVTRGGLPRIDNSFYDYAPASADEGGWYWKVTRVMRSPDNKFYETLPYLVVSRFEWQENFKEKWNRLSSYAVGAYVYMSNTSTVWYVCTEATNPGDEPGVSGRWSSVNGPDYDPRDIFGDDPLIIGFGTMDGHLVSTAHPVVIDWKVWSQHVAAEGWLSSDDEHYSTRVYRGRDGRFGFVGEVSAPGYFFPDDGATPDFQYPPPEGNNPFDVYENGNPVPISTEHPSTVLYHEARRWFGGTPNRPGWIAGSAIEDYANFDEVIPAKDTDFLNFDLASSRYERIRALIGRQGLLVFTDNGEWIVGGSGQAEILTPSSIAQRRVSSHGSSALEPLELMDHILFMQRKGTVPRVMALGDGMRVEDASLFSRHFFNGHTIVSWCYAEDPWNLIWAVRDDGILLSGTFVPSQQMMAWTQHEIAGATVIDVCAVPEGSEDAVYVVTLRGSNYSLERLASRNVIDIYGAKFLDCHASYDGRNTATGAAAEAFVIAGGSGAAVNETVTMWIPEDNPNTYIGKILRIYTNDAQTTWFEVTCRASGSQNNYAGEMLDPLPAEWDNVGTTSWAISITTLAVPAVAGDTLYALADGNEVGPIAVQGGAATLPAELTAAVLVVGLKYNCDVESLDRSPERMRKQVVRSVILETMGSRGGFAGISFDDLEEVPLRAVSDNYEAVALRQEDVRVNVPSKWAEQGRVCYRQTSPVPIEILGITREVEVGG